ncbi:MAG: RNase adapter RapZ [Clostridia bacterium]|nr:RNase adapter RapZ [Clostridia bacterium]
MNILIVTGMSGAGKSKVVDALEDLGYFCVDNLPPKLLPTFSQLLGNASECYSKVAIVIDIRSSRKFDETFDQISRISEQGYEYKLLFIDANDETLIKRYKETRRIHPLIAENKGSLSKSIAQERIVLSKLLSIADYYLDTTNLAAMDCKKKVAEMLLENQDLALHINCVSFGFKYGVPTDCDLMFDVRCLPNPFYVPELRNHTGLEKSVSDYVLSFEEATTLLQKLYDVVDYLLPLYVNEGKSQLTIAFGCTGGQHRSVCFAHNMYEHIKAQKYNVSESHRELSK